ncbi:hypothetical protein [Paraclostridium sordellii]|uniref:hypothetical protein n=1 Tax=Paraclostridium sordellii TaxID=1505 RepID=UPI0003016050|nr:hypothetical protein [Paeniclostridium sordellii]
MLLLFKFGLELKAIKEEVLFKGTSYMQIKNDDSYSMRCKVQEIYDQKIGKL